MEQGLREAAGLLQREQCAQPRAAQVGIHRRDPQSRLGHGRRQVGHSHRLALARAGTGHQDRAQRPVHARKAHVGPQGTVGLGGRGARLADDDELVVVISELADGTQGVETQLLADVCRGLDRVVQVVDQEGDAHSQHGARRRAEEDVAVPVLVEGQSGLLSRLKDDHVVRRHGRGEAHLLIVVGEHGVGVAVAGQDGLQAGHFGLFLIGDRQAQRVDRHHGLVHQRGHLVHLPLDAGQIVGISLLLDGLDIGDERLSDRIGDQCCAHRIDVGHAQVDQSGFGHELGLDHVRQGFRRHGQPQVLDHSLHHRPAGHQLALREGLSFVVVDARRIAADPSLLGQKLDRGPVHGNRPQASGIGGTASQKGAEDDQPPPAKQQSDVTAQFLTVCHRTTFLRSAAPRPKSPRHSRADTPCGRPGQGLLETDRGHSPHRADIVRQQRLHCSTPSHCCQFTRCPLRCTLQGWAWFKLD